MCIHSLNKFNLLITIYPYSYLHEIIGLDDFLQRNENRWVTTKDYYIKDVQTWFPVQLAFDEFLSKIKGIFWGSAVSMNLAKTYCTEKQVCTSCDIVFLGSNIQMADLFCYMHVVFFYICYLASKNIRL